MRRFDSFSVVDFVRENFYTAAITAATRIKGAVRPLTSQAEYPQPPRTANPLYNDSHYFNFFDPEQKIGGFTRIGKLTNQRTVNGFFFIFLEREALMFIQGEALSPGSKDIRCSSVRYEILEPLHRLRVAVTGEFLRIKNPQGLFDPPVFFSRVKVDDFVKVDLDLIFTGDGAVHDFSNMYARGLARRMVEKGIGLKDLLETRKFAVEHYEQVGVYQGTIKVGRRKIVINATGHRDHSWGPRDMTAPAGWIWITAQFAKAAALNLTWFKAGKLDLFTGYLHRGGKNYPYRSCRIDTEFEADGITQKRVRFEVEDTGGFKMEVEGKVLTPVPIVLDDGKNRAVVIEGMTEFHWGDRTAYGVAEYMHKIY